MRRLIIPLFLLLLLAACIGRQPVQVPVSLPTATHILAPSPAAPSSPSPSLFLILTDFPLAVGATWEYSAEITYQDPNDPARLLTWTGLVTDRVLDKRTDTGGVIVFTVKEDMDPIPPEPVWRRPRSFEYTVSGDGVFTDTRRVYQYPLQEAQSWPAFEDTGYEVTVQVLGEVITPFGILDDCYNLTLATNPDLTIDTFCSGIGFVEHSYRHFGTAQDEKFVLTSFTLGQR